MRPLGTRGAHALVAAVLLGTTLGGCAVTSSEPVRVGVLSDCEGFFRANGDLILRGAQMPFLARGAELLGPNPGDGVGSIHVAGRDVELVDGCVEGGEYTTLVRATRELIEKQHAVAVVGGSWPGDGLILRDVARRYPTVAFVVANVGPREVTLLDRAPNLVRFAADGAQATAGLGSFAASARHWRRVALLTTDRELGWQEEAAFVSEFCAAGGRPVVRDAEPWYMPADRTAVQALASRRDVDGVVVLGTPTSFPNDLLVDITRWAGGVDHVLLGPEFAINRTDLVGFPRSLDGVVGVSPLLPDGPALDQYTAEYQAVMAPESADPLNASVMATRDAVEAVLRGIEAAVTAGGSSKEPNVVDALTQVSLDGSAGSTALDDHGQALVTSRIVTYTASDDAARMNLVSQADAVDQSLGGRLSDRLEPHAGGYTCESISSSPP